MENSVPALDQKRVIGVRAAAARRYGILLPAAGIAEAEPGFGLPATIDLGRCWRPESLLFRPVASGEPDAPFAFRRWGDA